MSSDLPGGPRSDGARPEPRAAYQAAQVARAGGFVAIDFETATDRRESACALAAAVVEQGSVTEVRRWLIRPPGNQYNEFNVAIHGITPGQTAASPGIAEIWPEVEALFGDRPIVAHNAPFDISVVRKSIERLGVEARDRDYLCTLSLTRNLWPGWSSYSLPAVADAIGVELDHHLVESDAHAAAAAALACCGALDAADLGALGSALGVRSGRIHGGGMRWPAKASSARARRPRTSLASLSPRGEIDEGGELAGATVVFTGKLRIPRKEAAQRAVDQGAHCADSVTSAVDYLVCGLQDLTRTASGEGSSKLLKARKLAERGHPIEIISEADFLRMLADRAGGTPPTA